MVCVVNFQSRYATYGEVSPSVFAFGVVLLELLSGKEAILRGSTAQTLSGVHLAAEDRIRSLVKYVCFSTHRGSPKFDTAAIRVHLKPLTSVGNRMYMHVYYSGIQ